MGEKFLEPPFRRRKTKVVFLNSMKDTISISVCKICSEEIRESGLCTKNCAYDGKPQKGRAGDTVELWVFKVVEKKG